VGLETGRGRVFVRGVSIREAAAIAGKLQGPEVDNSPVVRTPEAPDAELEKWKAA
jgi:hypothetical protein